MSLYGCLFIKYAPIPNYSIKSALYTLTINVEINFRCQRVLLACLDFVPWNGTNTYMYNVACTISVVLRFVISNDLKFATTVEL